MPIQKSTKSIGIGNCTNKEDPPEYWRVVCLIRDQTAGAWERLHDVDREKGGERAWTHIVQSFIIAEIGKRVIMVSCFCALFRSPAESITSAGI